MDILKDYLKQNNKSEYDKELPAGDEERFDAAYESYRHRIHFTSSVKRRKKAFWKVALIPVAASFALVLITRLLLNPLMEDKTTKEMMTADQIYQNYLDQVNQYTNDIIAMTERMSDAQTIFAMQTLKQITEENRPITEVIPDDIPEKARANAVKRYTEQNISALDEYKELLVQMIE